MIGRLKTKFTTKTIMNPVLSNSLKWCSMNVKGTSPHIHTVLCDEMLPTLTRLAYEILCCIQDPLTPPTTMLTLHLADEAWPPDSEQHSNREHNSCSIYKKGRQSLGGASGGDMRLGDEIKYSVIKRPTRLRRLRPRKDIL
jgi:hypothetical protein